MRIVFMCPPESFSGGERVICIYANKLAERGHDVIAVMPHDRSPSLYDRARALRHGRWLSRPKRKLSFYDGARFEIHRFDGIPTVPDADAVIATWWETAEWVWSLSESKGRKFHLVQDYEIWGGNPARVDRALSLKTEKIVVSEWLRALLSRYIGQSATLIPNSVDTAKFSAPQRGKQPVFTVGFVYHGLPSKGADIAIAAINRARLTIPEMRVLSFGSSLPNNLPPRTTFKHMANDAEMAAIYASCDAWLFSTRIEGFGLPMLEAMACGASVLTTRRLSLPEVGGDAVAYCGVGAGDIAAALSDLFDDPERRAQLSAAAQLRAKEFTWAASAAKHRDAYARAAVLHRRGR